MGSAVDPEEAFGRVLRRLRTDRKLSQEQLALEADLQRNYISLLERGENSASVRTIFKLTAALGVSAAELFTQVESELSTKQFRRRATQG